MTTRATRRRVSAWALVAVAVSMWALPAAAADETSPSTPGPTGSVSPTPTPTDAPTPDPTPTPPVTPSPTPTPTVVDPISPTPGADPEPTPRVAPAPNPSRARVAPSATEDPDPPSASAVIGDFDCEALTTTVTLVNTDPQFAADFTTTVSHWSHELGFEDTWRKVVRLEPGDSATLTPPLREGYNTVRVDSTIASVTEKSGACGVFTVDPRATIDTFDCGELTVLITLDNSRSTEALYYGLSRTATGGLDPRTYRTVIDVAAGQVRTVVLPLLDDAVNAVSVAASGPSFSFPATAEGTCGYLRHAAVDVPDCGSLTATVTLDNTAVPVGTTYTVEVGDGLRIRFETSRTLVAGQSETLVVPLGDDTRNVVRVLGAQDWVLAERATACGTVVTDPSASIGGFECGTHDVPVTLDNSRSTTSVQFGVHRTIAGDDHSDVAGTYVLGPGEVRAVRATLEEGTVTEVLVTAGGENGRELASAKGPLCGLLDVGPVECDTMTFEVTLVNDDADHEYSRELFVSSTEFRKHRTAYHQEVRLAVGQRRVLTVPVAGLLGGDLRLEEPGTMEGAVLYEEPVEVLCPAGSGSAVDPTGLSASGSLAATGAVGLPQLLVAGVALLALGGALLGVTAASRRNRHLRTGKEVART
jgi:hypothetical protein